MASMKNFISQLLLLHIFLVLVHSTTPSVVSGEMIYPTPRSDQFYSTLPCGGVPAGAPLTAFEIGTSIQVHFSIQSRNQNIFVNVSLLGQDMAEQQSNFQSLAVTQLSGAANGSFFVSAQLPQMTCVQCVLQLSVLNQNEAQWVTCADVSLTPILSTQSAPLVSSSGQAARRRGLAIGLTIGLFFLCLFIVVGVVAVIYLLRKKREEEEEEEPPKPPAEEFLVLENKMSKFEKRISQTLSPEQVNSQANA